MWYHREVIQRIDRIEKELINLSKQSDAASAAFKTFQASFATFAADATAALNDIAAKPVGTPADPADAATLTDIATGLGTVAVTLADLDTKIKAADPGALPTGALGITGPNSLPQGVAGQVYAPVSFGATGGAGGNVFSATGLPAGLALSSSGVLTGTPAAAGSATVVVTVTDSAGGKAVSTLTLSIAAAVVGP